MILFLGIVAAVASVFLVRCRSEEPRFRGEMTFFEKVVIGLSATITSNDDWGDLNRKSHWVSYFTTHSDLLLPPQRR